MKSELKSRETVDGYRFELTEDKSCYECRGEVMYDDDHDETPEPGLWKAARKLSKKLNENGFPNADYDHSEKGWVEVYIN